MSVNFVADQKSSPNYYPFGMSMPGRSYTGKNYRYGFNGQEKDDEIKGSANSYTASFWEYDPRLGRRWNTDPIIFSWQSTYSCFNNNPLLFIDPSGQGAEVSAKREKGKVTAIEINANFYVHGKDTKKLLN